MDWAAFVVEAPWWFLTTLFLVGWVMFVAATRTLAGPQWMVLAYGLALILPFFLGLNFGPGGIPALIGKMGGDVNVTWDAIISNTVVLACIIAAILLLRRLGNQPKFAWIGVAFVTYPLGSVMHVILTKGEPYRSWLA